MKFFTQVIILDELPVTLKLLLEFFKGCPVLVALLCNLVDLGK